MSERTGDHWRSLDRRHCWHPFTRQQEWCGSDAVIPVIERARGVWLYGAEGERWFDGNSSIWTNLHGHGHPQIVAAIARQAAKLDHTSFLGTTHSGAVELAAELCREFGALEMSRVFFSDNGSTAIECALKMALQFRRQTGQPAKKMLASFRNGYHGDTLGAARVGGVDRFRDIGSGVGADVVAVGSLEDLKSDARVKVDELAAVILEPLIQGVNEMRPWPTGMLRELRKWCDENDVHLICDEVMTGFGRTGKMFACQHEAVVPDFLCLAKGITGGSVPLAATLTSERVYEGFLGDSARAFSYGHSYTANPIGCAAALASLRIFREEATLQKLPQKIALIGKKLGEMASRHPMVHEVRQCGMIVGVELRKADGACFAHDQRIGERFCRAAMEHGLLTRPILDTIVFMPPLCSTEEELGFALAALDRTLADFDDWKSSNE